MHNFIIATETTQQEERKCRSHYDDKQHNAKNSPENNRLPNGQQKWQCLWQGETWKHCPYKWDRWLELKIIQHITLIFEQAPSEIGNRTVMEFAEIWFPFCMNFCVVFIVKKWLWPNFDFLHSVAYVVYQFSLYRLCKLLKKCTKLYYLSLLKYR